MTPASSPTNYETEYQLLLNWIKQTQHQDVSDLFFTADFPPAAKINGTLITLSKQILSADLVKKIIFSIMSAKQKETLMTRKELNFSHQTRENDYFRINVFWNKEQISMVMRKINRTIRTIDDLELPPLLKELVMKKHGLILIVGAANNGKSTTLTAMVDYRNQHSSGHIITLEDPIEYIHQHKKSIITQRDIGVDTESWESALINTVRQSPDVIVIGEIRDKLSLEYALQFAQTGHLCLCTMHAGNVTNAIERIKSFYAGDESIQVLNILAFNLISIIAQRLIPTINKPGYKVALEILINNPAIKDLIMKNKIDSVADIILRSKNEGMITFDESIYQLYLKQFISYDNASKNVDSLHAFKLKVRLDPKNTALKTSIDPTTLKILE